MKKAKLESFIAAKHDTVMHQVYGPEGTEENPVPDNTPCFVYFSNDGDTEGWLRIENHDDMGLNALIARSWITEKELTEIFNRESINDENTK